MSSAEDSDPYQTERLDGSTPSEESNQSKGREEKPTLGAHRMTSRGHSPPLALVYSAETLGLGIEEINEANSMFAGFPTSSLFLNFPIEKTNSFEVQLPRWRNRVDVYTDMEERTGYTATLRLNRLGLKKNWQRHLGMNYQVLFVKGDKPTFP